MKYIERKCCDILLTGKLVPDNFRAYPEEFHSHILYKLQSLIETYLKDIPLHILYGTTKSNWNISKEYSIEYTLWKMKLFFYKLYIDYNRRKLGLGKKICIDFLDRIEKKL